MEKRWRHSREKVELLQADGLVAVPDDAVLAVPQHRSRQHGALDVGAEAHQVFDAVPVIDPHHVLLDDRSLVEVFGDVVRCRADEFDAALLGAPVRRRADERRQERVVDVDQRAADLGRGSCGVRICM